MTILMWVSTVLLGLFFLFAGTVKVFGVPEKMFNMQKERYFDQYGIDRNGIRAIGLAEYFGGITVWFWSVHPIALAGLAVLVIVTGGAIFYHLRYDTPQEAGPAIVMLTLSGTLLLLNLFS